MSNDVETVQFSDATEVNQLSSSAAVESNAGSCDEEMPLQLLNEAVRSMPNHVVKALLSTGVCSRCVLRIFGIEDRIYCHPLLSQSMLRSNLEEVTGFKSEGNFQFCSICLGILQFSYCDDKGTMVKMESPNDMALTIAELVKKEGHQIERGRSVNTPTSRYQVMHYTTLHIKFVAWSGISSELFESSYFSLIPYV